MQIYCPTAYNIENRSQAIHYALDHMQENDILLVAGKGHEVTQNIRGTLLPCDDKKIIMDAFS